MRRAIVEGGRDDFAPVLEAIRACGALDYARDAARARSATRRRAALARCRLGIQGSLLELASFSVTRDSVAR